MNKKYKNYFDDIKNKKIQDKFIEHFIRLLFFAIILSIEAVYKKCKDILFHIRNILRRRTLSDVLKKYSRYKESVSKIIHSRVPVHNLHERVHDTINRLFDDEEKNLVFGIKDSTHNFIEKSKNLFASMSAYTKSMNIRHFKYTPFAGLNKNYTASMLTLFILKKYRNHKSNFTLSIDPGIKKEYAAKLSTGYKKFINETFNKFYSNELKKKITIASIEINSFKPHVTKIFETIEKLEKKHIKYTLGQS